ncbi:ABC transporter permease [Corynebacterium poyangense]|nr:ABC transporter permease [Corynebacterium poyangense]
MNNLRAVSKRIFLQFRHDPRTAAILFVAPVIVMWLLSLVLNVDGYRPVVATQQLPDAIHQLYEEEAEVIPFPGGDETEYLREGHADAVIKLDDDKLHLLIDGSDPVRMQAVIKTTQGVLDKYTTDLIDQQHLVAGVKTAGPGMITGISTDTVYGDTDWKTYDYLGPALLGIFLLVFTFITSQMALVSERAQGTLERFLATPVKPWEIVGGYAIAFGVIGLIQTLIISGMGMWLVGLRIVGNFGWVITIGMTLTITSVVMGLMVSSYAKTPIQVVQLMLAIVSPQILLSGVFNLSAAPRILQILSELLPLRHGVNALKSVMIKGEGWSAISFDIGIMWLMIVIFFIIATWGLRKKTAKRHSGSAQHQRSTHHM